MEIRKSNYYPIFDVLRFCVASILVCYHFQMFTHSYHEAHINFAFVSFDYQRLTGIFLELSGFLAINSIQNAHEKQSAEKKIRSYFHKYKNYVMRFIPTLYLSMFVILAIGLPYYYENGVWLWGYPLTKEGIVSSFLLSAQCGICCNYWAVNGVSWYLFALFRILIVFYGVQLLPRRIRPYSYILLCFIGYYVDLHTYPGSRLIPWIGGWAGKAFGGFFLGVLLFEISKIMKKIHKIIIGIILICYYFLLCKFTVFPADFIIYTDFFLCAGIILLSSALCCNKVNFATYYVGKISLYIFFWHVPILFIYGILLQKRIITNIVPFYTKYILLGITIIFSIFYQFIIEKPFNKLLKIN